ncbi:unnamed protein product [Amoebophrya sp. A25]|nr:unnamed protein product [Amoebophrya sp. A25]|eukprot:GSA25T00027059001.1
MPVVYSPRFDDGGPAPCGARMGSIELLQAGLVPFLLVRCAHCGLILQNRDAAPLSLQILSAGSLCLYTIMVILLLLQVVGKKSICGLILLFFAAILCGCLQYACSILFTVKSTMENAGSNATSKTSLITQRSKSGVNAERGIISADTPAVAFQEYHQLFSIETYFGCYGVALLAWVELYCHPNGGWTPTMADAAELSGKYDREKLIDRDRDRRDHRSPSRR